MQPDYPITTTVTRPARSLNRLSTLLRPLFAIPIFVIVDVLSADAIPAALPDNLWAIPSELGLLIAAPLLTIVFVQRYPMWWFTWNRDFLRFMNRVIAYLALMSDQYPSTEDEQYVKVELDYPDVKGELNRWLPLVKWILVIPHLVIVMLLWVGAVFAVFAAWLHILFTGRYPSGIFDYVEGVMRWTNRVIAYSAIMVTDRYPPFRLTE